MRQHAAHHPAENDLLVAGFGVHAFRLVLDFFIERFKLGIVFRYVREVIREATGAAQRLEHLHRRSVLRFRAHEDVDVAAGIRHVTAAGVRGRYDAVLGVFFIDDGAADQVRIRLFDVFVQCFAGLDDLLLRRIDDRAVQGDHLLRQSGRHRRFFLRVTRQQQGIVLCGLQHLAGCVVRHFSDGRETVDAVLADAGGRAAGLAAGIGRQVAFEDHDLAASVLMNSQDRLHAVGKQRLIWL